MSVSVTPDPVLPEVLHVVPVRHSDVRGWFSETYNAAALKQAGITSVFLQDNQSRSESAGTVRGLHFQAPPHAQAKLVRCVRGRILDVAVDIRNGSPRFGQFTVVELTEERGNQLFVPEGFAHGFCTLEQGCEIAYKVTAPYAPESDGGIAFDDPDIGIRWPFGGNELCLSEKDRKLPRLRDLPGLFSMGVHG